MVKICIKSKISETASVVANSNANLPAQARTATRKTGKIFQIISSKLYVPVVTLPMNNNIKVLENIKQGFESTISWENIELK